MLDKDEAVKIDLYRIFEAIGALKERVSALEEKEAPTVEVSAKVKLENHRKLFMQFVDAVDQEFAHKKAKVEKPATNEVDDLKRRIKELEWHLDNTMSMVASYRKYAAYFKGHYPTAHGKAVLYAKSGDHLYPIDPWLFDPRSEVRAPLTSIFSEYSPRTDEGEEQT